MYQFGEVKDINDPEKLGRVKVSVYGIHDNIPTYSLPWSNVLMPASTPATLGHGHSVNLKAELLWKTGDLLPWPITTPAPEFKTINDVAEEYTFNAGSNVPRTGDVREKGSLVCGIFLDSAAQEFLVIGTLPTKSLGVHDNNVRTRAEDDPFAGELGGQYEPLSPYNPKYPYNHVYETESGHVKEYDDTPGHERIKERHAGGTQYEIGPDGSKVERIVRDNYQLVAGNDTLEVKGNVKIIVSGNANIAVAKDLTTQVGGNMSSIVTGNMTADISGATNVTSAGDMTLKVPTLVESTTVSGAWADSNKKIILNGNVDVTHTLRTNTDSAVTIQSDAINLNTHIHTQPDTGADDTSQGNTNGPQNPE